MVIDVSDGLGIACLWVYSNFTLFLIAFLIALYINFNFNTVMVGLIYLLPLIPAGLEAENAVRFLIVSFQNTVFGLIELVLFVITVRSADAAFDKSHIKQLIGHTLPIAAALMGLSFISRMTLIPVTWVELGAIMLVFFAGSILRVIATYQMGARFKFDIVFREEQTLKTDQLYATMRHPSYTAMMLVILAYAMNTHQWIIGGIGLALAWLGFQYRIYHEENALKQQFGEEYLKYHSNAGMWFPKLGGAGK
ncbi:MAG: methyltransferase family protein [Nitrospinales bacterium]